MLFKQYQMNILKDELLEHRSFLRLTRDYALEMSESCQVQQGDLKISLKDSGVLVFEPENPGPFDIIISSGIHGNETAPIEICDFLVKEILSGTVVVKNRLLVIIGNPVAMNSGKRFENENLNRLFCGKHQGKSHPEARRAERLEHFTREFFNHREPVERCHFDLHTAIKASKYEKFVIYPYQDGREWSREYLNFFKHCDINTILLAHQGAGTFAYFSSHQFQSNAFTVELGQVKAFGENQMSSFAGVINNLKALISNTYVKVKEFNNNDFNLFQVIDEVMRNSDTGFSLNINSDVANFSTFAIGFQLTTDDNASYYMKSDQHAIVFPNAAVPPGQRVALIAEKTMI